MSLRDRIIDTIRAYDDFNAIDLWNAYAYRVGQDEAHRMEEYTLRDMFEPFQLVQLGQSGNFDTDDEYFWYNDGEWVSGDDRNIFNTLIDEYEYDIADDIIEALENGDSDYDDYGFDEASLDTEYVMSEDEAEALNEVIRAKQNQENKESV